MESKKFYQKKSLTFGKLYPKLKIKGKIIIKDIKPLFSASKNDISFFDSIKYKSLAINTKAFACITTEKLKNFLPNSTQKIVVKNVLFELASLLKKFYPYADIDYPDLSLKKASINKYKSVKFGNNVLIGKNVKIGKNTIIGSNTIIQNNVI